MRFSNISHSNFEFSFLSLPSKNLIGFLVVVPGHPEHGAFYLITGLLTVVDEYSWDSPTNKLRLLSAIIGLLAAFSQKKLPYSVDRVVSNDDLFAGEEVRFHHFPNSTC